VTAPAPEPLTSIEAVRLAISQPDLPEPELAPVVDAVNALVPAPPHGVGWLSPDADGGWDAAARHGAAMLAARLYRRRDSPGGMAAFGADAGAVISGNWPDIALLLRLGNYTRPAVG